MRIFLIAGEPSGDRLGGQLIQALRSLRPDIVFAGIGAEEMAAQGVASPFDTRELAIVGIAEAVPKIPLVLRRIRETLRAGLDFAPDIVVTIDSPSFSLEVAERLRRARPQIRLVHYAAPQVWAWKAWRAKAMAKYLDRLLALLPFEPPFFEAHGLSTVFVGHPVAAARRDDAVGAQFRATWGLAAERPVLAVLPGSRSGEVRRLMPIFKETLALLGGIMPDLAVCVPTLPHVETLVREASKDWPIPAVVVAGEARNGLFEAANAALTASGTVTLELAAAEVPMVVTYKVNPLTAAIVRKVVRVRFAALPNLVLDREVVPELIQENATPSRLAGAVADLLRNRGSAAAQIADLKEVMQRLGRDGEAPALRAARAVLALERADA